MTGMETVFLDDPWWIVLIKVVGIFVLLLTWTIFNVWFERRVLGKMQNRKGPIMNGPLGLGQALGDGVKLLLKEDFRPARTDAVVFSLAPMLTGVAAFASWAVIPLGGPVRMFGVETRLQLTDLPVAALVVMAIAGVGFYGFVLAGWSSNGTYSLLGSMRATAQVISYEIAMGLSLVAVFMYAGTMSTSQIVAAQQEPINLFGFTIPLPSWYGLLLLPSFVIYYISMFGETNRQPFDMPECESELVSGHITDFSGFRYALFFLAEYINVATVSAVCVTLFLGGYHAPWPLAGTFVDQGWFGLLWFVLKVQIMFFTVSWVRAAVPRVRYDQMMKLGWKVLIPANLAWIVLLALVRGASVHGWWANPIFIGTLIVFIAAVVAVIWMSGPEPEPEPEIADEDAEFDAFAGGYPVPPMPGQKLINKVVTSTGTEEPVGAASGSARRSSTSNGAEL
ncbi:NADH-quinone oxidoreductase subunit NuoH [Propionimicrobium sp. PCR01-08-3]|uniref:NADH-quinone oxidoreductase subunit NuoH n=1 Tax=Propionimicrobium sp. PCR01-08-3 TaxID=3052086 RepID=UPI00255CF758|nr:NADH-quinone oxidoreductase subunit NuoH [Propionimicrobium sp. PCR01-08-3]WIY83129.1 NADH-quinone oxidoreductase subunit NuoH [Propionimicrobium sp. PCR01-08-3]